MRPSRRLERIGPPAIGFAPALIQRMERSAYYSFDGAKALGSIGRDDPCVVEALLQWLRDADRDAALHEPLRF